MLAPESLCGRPLDDAEDDDRARLEMPDEMLDSTEAHDLRLNADLVDGVDFVDLHGDLSLGELSGVVVDPALAPGGVEVSGESDEWVTGRAPDSCVSSAGCGWAIGSSPPKASWPMKLGESGCWSFR